MKCRVLNRGYAANIKRFSIRLNGKRETGAGKKCKFKFSPTFAVCRKRDVPSL